MKTQFVLKNVVLNDQTTEAIIEKCEKIKKVSLPNARVECRVEGELPNKKFNVSLSCIEPDHSWIGEASEESVMAATDVALDSLMREIRRAKDKDRKIAREKGRNLKNQIKNIT